ncbi:MAG: TIGR04282 family arsenosugar biosynthesis glycosyltransferase [Pseudohongiellaceae bacterium]|nr:TIGR04282 family arsenosugar biosynthesis glycosyltransferase [Pseudohongiellaceae bacterium]
MSSSSLAYKFPRAVLAVFAKQPVLGSVKTRLVPQLGEEGALAIHKQLIEYTVGNCQQARLCPLQIWVAHNEPAGPFDSVFLNMADKRSLYYQQGEGLGQRMAFTVKQALEEAESVVLIGADCPSVDADYIEQALTGLEDGAEVVVGPAEDGGYVLLGLRRFIPQLFEDIAWGTDQVLAQTRVKLGAEGVRWLELDAKWDVDRPEDLERLSTLRPSFNEV